MYSTEFLKIAIASTFTEKQARKLIGIIEHAELVQKVKEEYHNRPTNVGSSEMIGKLADKYNKSTSSIDKYIFASIPYSTSIE